MSKPVSPEDLKKGHYIVITGLKNQEEPEPFGMFPFPRQKPSFNGEPLQVIAVDLPFISITDVRGRVGALDFREVEIRKVTTHYADSFYTAVHTNRNEFAVATQKRPRKKKEKPDPRNCPNCGTRRVERLVGNGQWSVVCPNCGKDNLQV